MKMSVVLSLSRVQLFVTPWTVACQVSLPFTISQSFLKFMCIELVMLSNHLIHGRPFLLLASIFLSIRVFSNELALCIREPKYWSFSISPSNEYSGLFSFRIDQFVNNFKYNINSMYIVAYERQIQVLLFGTFWSVLFFF